MNSAILIMSSAVLAGADPAPPPPPPAAPIVVNGGAGCNNCGAAPYAAYAGDCCGKKPGLFERFRGRIGGFGHKSKDCGCAPAPECNPCPPPPPVCNPCPTTCHDRPNLLDTLRARWAKKKSCTPAPVCCDPCAGAPLGGYPAVNPIGPGIPPGVTPGVPPGGANPTPKEMPKPKDKEKGSDKGSSVTIPPVPPVTGAGAQNSPY